MNIKKDNLTELKAALQLTPLATPDIETVEPEIRSGAQYAKRPSMITGLKLNESDDTSDESEH